LVSPEVRNDIARVMLGLRKIDRALGAVVGFVLGATGGSTPMLWSETLYPGSTHWEQCAVCMLPVAIVGLVSGLIVGVRSIFDFR
jgi:hypothetical protein